MAAHKLAVIIKNSSNDAEFLLVKQTRPPKFDDPEYDSYVDSDLWDLPSAELKLLDSSSAFPTDVRIEESCLENFDPRKFDLRAAIDQALGQVGLGMGNGIEWKFWKLVEEPEFGPGIPVKTVYIVGKLGAFSLKLKGATLLTTCAEDSRWMNEEDCANMLLKVTPGDDRLGPLVVGGLLDDLGQSGNCKIPTALPSQEYPPGVKLIPMGSRTQKPFLTTNLVVIVPQSHDEVCCDKTHAACGDALIVDPGCKSALHEELREIIAALPRKLVVFVTHHHRDHVDGLSVVQECNPEASLLAHENTMQRVGKDDWSLSYTSVIGSEEICIGGQRLRIISAPGHTDGHMALLHVSTHMLIVGDHCVGQGSAILDITSGGNMTEYFRTTYKFMELSPHAIVPMHGRVNMWPKHMLCGYLKNRRSRESTILKAIEDGATTLFDIVAYTYADVHRSFWIPAASNVRLHVDHLAEQDKLPKDFLLDNFNRSCTEFPGKLAKI